MHYRETSNISRTLVGNNIVDHLNVVWQALLELHLDTRFNTWLQLIVQKQLQDETRGIYVWGFGAANIRDLTVISS